MVFASVALAVALLLLLACAVSAQPPGAPAEQPATALKDVMRIGYHEHLCPFPGSLCVLLDYPGETTDQNYLMGVSGACFRRIWNRDDGDNVDLSYSTRSPGAASSRH